MELPAPVRDFIQMITEDTRSPAYLLIDDEQRIVVWGGEISSYGLTGLAAGADAAERVPFLAGLLPLDLNNLLLPDMQLQAEASADIYLFRREQGTWVLLLDVTREAARRQRLQQRANEAGLEAAGLRREEEALSQANLILEERVRERTQELVRVNLRLMRELEERKRMEQALRESEAQFRRLYDANIIGIMFWNPRGAISDANDAYLEMIGYTREDLEEGRILWNYASAPEAERAEERAFAEMREAGACRPFMRQFIRKDGSRIELLFGAALLPGTPERIVCFALDPTKYL